MSEKITYEQALARLGRSPGSGVLNPAQRAARFAWLSRTWMPPSGKPFAYLALGDAFTAGQGLREDGTVRDLHGVELRLFPWPVMLALMLTQAGLPTAAPRIVAQAGWTTAQLAAALDALEPLGEYDFVTLLIGINDQLRGLGVEPYRERFAALLQRAMGYARGEARHVIALAIPDWSATPFAARFAKHSGGDTARIARELTAFNAAAQEICNTHGVAFVDIGYKFLRDQDAKLDRLADDGLHPSAQIHGEWAGRAFEVVSKVVQADEDRRLADPV